jgi:4-amino-4-deoxy-L-arabinose transferase-like glycosyltransferase
MSESNRAPSVDAGAWQATPKREWVQRAVLIAAVGFSFFIGLGGVPLFDKDEGAFCEATREMVTSGNYLMPYMNGAPRYDKPILIYWLQAAGVKAFGLNEFAVRFPSAAAAAAWALATYLFVRRVLGADTAFLTTFLLVTALQVTIIAKAAIADAVLNCFIAMTMFDFYSYLESGHRRFYYRAMVAMALGTLTKGPVAIMIPLASTLIFCLVQRDGKRWARTFADWRGILLFLVIAAPWYVAAIIDQGRPILEAWVLKQTLTRLNRPLEGHSGGFLYYVPVVLAGLMPYTTLLFKAAANLRTDLKSPLVRYMLIWFAFVFVFFSFSGTKLPHYVIYGYTGLFIVLAIQIQRLRHDFWLALPSIAMLALLLLVPHALPLISARIKDGFARIVISESVDKFDFHYLVPLLLALIAVSGLALFRRIPRTAKIAVLGLVMTGIVNFHILPLAGQITQVPIKEAALLAKQRGYDVHLWKLNMPSFYFYREKIMPKNLDPEPRDVVLTKATLLRNCPDAEVIYEKNGIVMARLQSTACLTEGTEK